MSIGLGIRNVKNSHFRAKSALAISKTIAWIKKFYKVGVSKVKEGFGSPKKFLGVPQNEKTDFLNNPPSKKVVTYVPIFRLVIVRPLHWPFVRDILFSLTLLQEGCV